MAVTLLSSSGAGIMQTAGDSVKELVKSSTLFRSAVATKGAPIKSTSYLRLQCIVYRH